MKKIIYFAAVLFTTAVLSSCEEEIVYATADVVAPQTVTNVDFGAKGGSVIFNVAIDPALTATYTATGSNVTITNPTGAVSGSTVTVNFDAGAAAGAASITLTVTDSQGKKDEATAVVSIGQEVKEVLLTNNITTNTTWSASKTYILGGRITVVSGVTLTIEPGTVIKGQAGTGANATALLVARGAKINAAGTAALPIIFTSVADEITNADLKAGKYASPNLANDVNGLWGGVIILGKAKISASNSADKTDKSEVQIEGIPTSDSNGLYGGTDDTDNSGVLKYVSIRHGGTNIGSGNEINGLTLGGVGNGTVIENIEIVANQDDGIEWFGGSVNVKNVIVWNVGDDAIDTDQSWSGTLDNFVVVTPAGHCFELDGPEGSYVAAHTIQNGTIIASIGTKVAEDLINVDANSGVTLKNLYFTGIAATNKVNRVTAPNVVFEGIEFNVAEADLQNYVTGAVPAGIKAGKTQKANIANFGWTWANESIQALLK